MSRAFGEAVAIFAPGRRSKNVFAHKATFGSLSRRDMIYGGNRHVPGTVAVAGTPDVPVAREVVLFDVRTKRPIRALISAPSGEYDFQNVAPGPWFVVSYDHTGEYNAVIADNIMGEPM